MTELEIKNEREDHKLAGDVTVEEARQILSRYNSLHFSNRAPGPHGRAIYSIPADPSRDSDIRLGAFIAKADAAFMELERLRGAIRATITELQEEAAEWSADHPRDNDDEPSYAGGLLSAVETIREHTYGGGGGHE